MGGSVIAAFDIANCLNYNSKEFENTIVGPYLNDETLDYFKSEYPNIQIIGFPVDIFKHSFVSTRLMKWLSNNMNDYHAVHCHSIFKFPTLVGAHMAKQKKVPLVISPHNSLDPYDLQKKYLIKKFLYGPLLLRPIISCATLLCTTPLEQERIIPFTKKEVKKNNIPLPVKVKDFETDVEALKKRYQINDQDKVLLFLSRIDRKKGLELIFKSIKELSANRVDHIKLVIAGIGDQVYQKELQQLAKELDIENLVIWTGFVTGSEKASLYQLSNIFVLPSYNENFGIVVAEAMKYGKAILISKEVYLYPILEEKNSALICETTLESVRSHLDRLLNNVELCNELGKNAIKAFEVFEVENLSAKYQAFFKSLIED